MSPRSLLVALLFLVGPACSDQGAVPGRGDAGSDGPEAGRPGGVCFPNRTCYPGAICHDGLCVEDHDGGQRESGSPAGDLRAGADRRGSDSWSPDRALAGPDRGGLDGSKPKPDTSKPDTSKPDTSKPDTSKPWPDQGPDPCAGVSCGSPPSPACVGASLRTFSKGSCVAGACSYPYTDTPCPGGCSSAVCQPPTCQGQICNTPPAPSCSSTAALTTYAPQGVCKNGTCDYQKTPIGCSLGCLNGSCIAGSWQVSTPPIGIIGGDDESQNLVLDAADEPHVFGCKSALHHAHRTPTGWVVDTVDNVAGCSFDALVTPAGQVVIAYFDPINKDLRLARSQPGGAFSISLVDSLGDVGRNPALALLGTSLVIAYTDVTGQGIKVAQETAAGWALSGPTGIKVGQYGNQSSLLVDAQQNLHLLTGDFGPWEAYWGGSKTWGCVPVVYARRTPSGSWTVTSLATGGIVPRSRALTFGPAGQLEAVWISVPSTSTSYPTARPVMSTALVAGAWTPPKFLFQTNTSDARSTAIFVAGGKLGLAFIDHVTYTYPTWVTKYMQRAAASGQWSELFRLDNSLFKDVAVGKDGRARLLLNQSYSGPMLVLPP